MISYKYLYFSTLVFITLTFVLGSSYRSVSSNDLLVGNDRNIRVSSSDILLVSVFNWARKTSDSFVGKDSLTGREAFCIRDICHQCIGAEILWHGKQNLNMFHKFVENISEAKDYCSYWEIMMLKKFTNGRGRTYPEMSFTAIEPIASGLMGIEMEVRYPQESITQSGYVDRSIVTISRLSGGKGWAELNHFSVRATYIKVCHEDLNKTIMTKHGGSGMIWKAKFYGSFDILYVNNYTVKATEEVQYPGGPAISWAILEVAPGESVTVRTNK